MPAGAKGMVPGFKQRSIRAQVCGANGQAVLGSVAEPLPEVKLSQDSEMPRSRCVLVPYHCCNKLPQPWWLKRTQTHYLTDLEARVQNQSHRTTGKVSAGLVPSGGPRGASVSLLLWGGGVGNGCCPYSLSHGPTSHGLSSLLPSSHQLL